MAGGDGPGGLRGGHEEYSPIDAGWELAATAAGEVGDPARLDHLEWVPARVPGTVAGARRDAPAPLPGSDGDLDALDWLFRTRFPSRPAAADESVTLEIGGIATVADVYLNGTHLLHSDSMFAIYSLALDEHLRSDNELLIHCHALAPLLGARRKPRARWRTQLVDGRLRFFRTMLLGRAPGLAPDPPTIGPWRPLGLRRRRRLSVDRVALRPGLAAEDGRVEIDAEVALLDGPAPSAARLELTGPTGRHGTDLSIEADAGRALLRGVLTVRSPARWMPHTHGEPALYAGRLSLKVDGGSIVHDVGSVGFRTLTAGPGNDHDVESNGLDLHVNGQRVFARGAVWTPIDPIGMAPSRDEIRRSLETFREAGLNMVRVVGTAAYETADFHDLCDELGIMVWQDFMFANLDYPIGDPQFRAVVDSELGQVLDRLSPRPSTVVLCGNSEVEQQVAMLGLDPALGRGELFGEILPNRVADSCDAVYVPSAPCGGEMPFSTGSGIANYFGVGGYRRGLDDVRRSRVRFASECLAIANVPGEELLEAMSGAGSISPVVDPRWKAGVPRDAGSGWDFDDVRDHYFALLFGADPDRVRAADPHRYLELSRAVSGEIMAEVFGEWRRPGSSCGGGLVLWWRDRVAGAGWGLCDVAGRPKVALDHLRRVLAPTAVWTTDEGLDGIAVHVANDSPSTLEGILRVRLFRDGETLSDEAETPVLLAPHESITSSVESVIGRFVDAGYAYRFGPPQHDVVAVSLESSAAELLSQSFRFPLGPPIRQQQPAALGLDAEVEDRDEEAIVTVRSRRVAYGVRIHADGFRPSDNAFNLEPGGRRTIRLRRVAAPADAQTVSLTAVNMTGKANVAIRPPDSA